MSDTRILGIVTSFGGAVLGTVEGGRPRVVAEFILSLTRTFGGFCRSGSVLMRSTRLEGTELTLIYTAERTLRGNLGLLKVRTPREVWFVWICESIRGQCFASRGMVLCGGDGWCDDVRSFMRCCSPMWAATCGLSLFFSSCELWCDVLGWLLSGGGGCGVLRKGWCL